MQSACNLLVNAGFGSPVNRPWQLIVLASLPLVVLISLRLKRNRNWQLRYFLAIFLLLFVASQTLLSNTTRAAAAPIPATSCHSQTPGTRSDTNAPVTNPDELNLVNDSYNNSNGIYYQGAGNGWAGTLDVLPNDQPPTNDPIDPTSIRLVGQWPANVDYNASQGIHHTGIDYWILNPADSTNPTDPNHPTDPSDPWAEFALDIDSNGNPVDGLVNVYIYPSAPQNSTFTIQYTAKTMSGVVATHDATITVTNDGLALAPTPPPPTLVNDSYLMAGNQSSADISVLDNDQPQPNDALDTSRVRLIDPTDSSNNGLSFTVTTIPGDTNSKIIWTANYDGTVTVNFGPDVAASTPYSIQYIASSLAGITATIPATISVSQKPRLRPTLVNDSYTFGSTNDFGVLPVLSNDLPQPGDSMDTGTLQLIDPSTSGTTSQTQTRTIPGDNASFIGWQVTRGVVEVNFGADVPLDTPYTIQYVADSLSGGVPLNPATITVTKSSGVTNAVIIHSHAFDTQCGHKTMTNGTINLTSSESGAVPTTTVGVIDPASVDLDPFTPGRQTTFTNQTGTITVDNNGIVTFTNYTGIDNSPFFYTIANTNGDVSNVGMLLTSNNANSCG